MPLPSQGQNNACLNNLAEPKVHAQVSIFRDFLDLLLYFGLWMFGVNLSSPFLISTGQFGFRFGLGYILRVWLLGLTIMLVLWVSWQIGWEIVRCCYSGHLAAVTPLLWLGLDLTQFPSGCGTTDTC